MELQDWLDTVLEYLKVFAWPAVVLTLALVFRRPLIEVLQRLHKAAGFGASVELERALEQNARSLNEANLPDFAHTDEESAKAGRPEHAKAPEQPKGEGSPGQSEGVEPLEHPEQQARPGNGARPEFMRGGRHDLSDEDILNSNKQLWSPAALRRFWRQQPHKAAELGLPHPDATSPFGDAENYGRMMLAWAHLEAKAVRLGELINLSSSSARNLGVLSGKLLDRRLISHEAAEIARGLQRLRNELAHEVEKINISPVLTTDFVETAEKLDWLFAQLIEDLEDAAEI